MINHMRTLLLNLPAGTGDIYVPPSYSPVVIPQHFIKLNNAILTNSNNPEVLLSVVASWMPLLHGADFDGFSKAIDPRITYDPNNRKTVSSTDTVNIASLINRVVTAAVANAGAGQYGLFRPFAHYSEQLASIKKVWDTSVRSEERAVAAVYGYIYQLERIRTNA